MGRGKARKPKRPRKVRGPSIVAWYDEMRDFTTALDPPVLIPAGEHTLAMVADADGVRSRILLDEGGHIDLPKAYVTRSIGG